MSRKNYTSYKDGLSVVNLTVHQLKLMMDKNMCIKVCIRENGTKHFVRMRKKPLKKLTLAQQNAQLRYQVNKMAQLLKQKTKPTAHQLEVANVH